MFALCPPSWRRAPSAVMAACTSSYERDISHEACYSWCDAAKQEAQHCQRCKCRACAQCAPIHSGPRSHGQRPPAMQWENAAADKLLQRLSPRQRALQTWAAYGSFPLRDGRAEIRWPGCMGAVRQPIGASPRDSLRQRNAMQREMLRSCGGVPALFFQEALHGAQGDTVFPMPAALGCSWAEGRARTPDVHRLHHACRSHGPATHERMCVVCQVGAVARRAGDAAGGGRRAGARQPRRARAGARRGHRRALRPAAGRVRGGASASGGPRARRRARAPGRRGWRSGRGRLRWRRRRRRWW